MKWIITVFVMWFVLAANLGAFGQEEEAKPAEAPFYTIEQLQAGQAADLDSLNKIKAKYDRAFVNDQQATALRIRIQVRQGMIDREQLLKEKGVVNEKKLEKLESRD